MNVLMLNKFDGGGGAARAALRLHDGLRQAGVASQILVEFKTATHEGVVDNANPLTRALRKLRYADLLPARLYPNRPFGNFSPAWLPDGLAGAVARMKPDLVHLHWVGGGFLRLETLAKFKPPLVWTLHDSWAFTGGCHVPFECVRYRQRCGACPVLGSRREEDLSRRVWQRKRNAWDRLPLTVVTPSRWLAGCARSSSLFMEHRVVSIPNGLDTAAFKPVDMPLARERLGLPPGKKLVLFGGVAGTEDRNKGFPLLASALQTVADRAAREQWGLVTFGSATAPRVPVAGIEVFPVGRVDDDEKLVNLYAAADVFVAPSLLENLPNTVMEAMACGTPCVAFDQGGMPELIEHEQTGYLARPYEAADLAAGLAGILESQEVRDGMARCARLKVEKEFSLELATSRYVELYREALDSAAAGCHG